VALRRRTQELGNDESVNLLLVFPLLRSPPRCGRAVELWLRVLRFDHPQAVLAVYPSPPVVDIRPEAFVEPYVEARFAALDKDRDTAPHLRWRVTRGC